MTGQWFFSRDGTQQEGPVDKEALEQMLSAGELDAGALVWSPGLPGWIPASRAEALHFERPVTPPPLPKQAPTPPFTPKVSPEFQPPEDQTRTKYDLENIKIRPKSKRNAVLVGIGCTIFGIGGLLMFIDTITSGGNKTDLLGSLLAFVFFGIGGLIAVPKIFRRKVSMALAPDGLHQITIYGSVVVPWSDIEQVGIATIFGTRMLGIRLKTYDNYLANMSPELARMLTKSMPFLKMLAGLASLLPVPVYLDLWSQLQGKGDVKSALKGFGAVGNLASMLMWVRKTCGYDITMGWADFDRPAKELVKLIQNYQMAIGRKGMVTTE